METKTQFKTNIKCGACIATVTPYLNDAVGAGNWSVNLQDPARTLTIESGDTAAVKQAVEKAGYKAEAVTQ